MYTEYLNFWGELKAFMWQNDYFSKFFSMTSVLSLLVWTVTAIYKSFISKGREGLIKTWCSAREAWIVIAIIMVPLYSVAILYGALSVRCQRDSFKKIDIGMDYHDVVSILGEPDVNSKNGVIENTGQNAILALEQFSNDLARKIATNDYRTANRRKDSHSSKSLEWSTPFFPFKISIQFIDDKVSNKFREHVVNGGEILIVK